MLFGTLMPVLLGLLMHGAKQLQKLAATLSSLVPHLPSELKRVKELRSVCCVKEMYT